MLSNIAVWSALSRVFLQTLRLKKKVCGNPQFHTYTRFSFENLAAPHGLLCNPKVAATQTGDEGLEGVWLCVSGLPVVEICALN